MHSTQPSIWCKRNCDSSESVVQLSSSDAHVPLLLGFGSGWGVSMGTLTGFMQPYIKKKNGNPLCILILFYGDRIQHRRELALLFFLAIWFYSVLLPCASLSLAHSWCCHWVTTVSSLDHFWELLKCNSFLFTEGTNMIEHLRRFPVRVRTVNLMGMSVRKDGPQDEAWGIIRKSRVSQESEVWYMFG